MKKRETESEYLKRMKLFSTMVEEAADKHKLTAYELVTGMVGMTIQVFPSLNERERANVIAMVSIATSTYLFGDGTDVGAHDGTKH